MLISISDPPYPNTYITALYTSPDFYDTKHYRRQAHPEMIASFLTHRATEQAARMNPSELSLDAKVDKHQTVLFDIRHL